MQTPLDANEKEVTMVFVPPRYAVTADEVQVIAAAVLLATEIASPTAKILAGTTTKPDVPRITNLPTSPTTNV